MATPSEDSNKRESKVNPWEAYNFELNNNITVDVAAISLYVEHYYMKVILEAFLYHDRVNLKSLFNDMANNVPKHLLNEIPAITSQTVITKMVRLGYIKATEVPDDLPAFHLTEVGLSLLQNQVFTDLASTSFFSYQTHLLNKEMHLLGKRSLRINIVVGIIAVLSFVVSIAAVFLA